MKKIVPIEDPNRGFHIWPRWEIYDGTDKGGIIVPNVDDLVWDWSAGPHRVTQVDRITYLSTIVPWTPPTNNNALNPLDILSGAVPGRAGENYRLYINTKHEPVSACIDSRLTIYGSEQSYIRLFQGSDITDEGKVVSLYYGPNNRLTDDKWPLETVKTADVQNNTVKVPKNGFVIHGLTDGELVTCVVYNTAGAISSINPLLAQDTTFVRATNAPARYITRVNLETPFALSANPKIIEVPMHLPIDSLNLMGRVSYNDGTSRRVPVDGTKMELAGLETFTVSQVGQTIPLVLMYHLSPEESTYAATDDAGSSITERYSLTTTTANGSYNVKLFVSPMWNRIRNQWELKYFLYNLDRNMAKDVTAFVETGVDGGIGFDPLLYGTVQRLTVAINMRDIDENNHPFRHVQAFEITLFTPIGQTLPNWTLRYNVGSGEIYGEDVIGRGDMAADGQSVDMILSSGNNWMNDWLDNVYRDTYPLFNPDVTSKPPLPTHVTVCHGDVEETIPVEAFADSLAFPSVPHDGDTLLLKWIKRIEAKDLQLGLSPMTFRYN